MGLDFQLYDSTELHSSRYTWVFTNAAGCGAQRQAEMFYDVLNGHSEPVPLAVQLSQCREQLWSSSSQHSQGMEAGWTSYWRLEMNRYLRDKKCKCVHLQCFHFKAVAKLLFSLISLPSLQKGLSKVLGAGRGKKDVHALCVTARWCMWRQHSSRMFQCLWLDGLILVWLYFLLLSVQNCYCFSFIL